MEHKFTTDGKKVAIVGKLNAQETIVQEIFVTESGAEIPQGENFVVKSLLDEPAKRWKQKAIEDSEKNYESNKRKYEEEERVLRIKYKQLIQDLKDKISSIRQMNAKLSRESFDRVFDFVSGEITHVVYENYSDLSIVPFDKFLTGNEYGLKLVTLYGKDDGTLSFRLNEYSDGSGGSKTFFPFKSHEDAVLFLSERLVAKEKIYAKDIETANKYGVVLDAEKISAARDYALEQAQKNIENALKQYEGYKLEVEAIKEKYK
jgi:hypothetical protein